MDTDVTLVDTGGDNQPRTRRGKGGGGGGVVVTRSNIVSCEDVVRLTRAMLEQEEVDLVHLSLIYGLVEHQLTQGYCLSSSAAALGDSDQPLPFEIPYPGGLVDQFRTLVKGSVDLSQLTSRRQAVDRVAEVIWGHLVPWGSGGGGGSGGGHGGSHGHGEDKVAHLQFLPSLLLERKLDAFGVSCACLCALQLLYPRDWAAHFALTLSEDHSWITVREELPGGAEVRVEVTWHGREDMRHRNPVSRVAQPDNWLYLRPAAAAQAGGEDGGGPVVCRGPAMALAALVSALNPSCAASVVMGCESLALARLQRDLLQLLYCAGALDRYPMALASLADLQELLLLEAPKATTAADHQELPGRLYAEAVASARQHYGDSHIYPHTYLAGFQFRSLRFDAALASWARAASVVAKYNYVARDDEEAYKEFQGIASDLIPYSLRRLEGGGGGGGLRWRHYRDVLVFYDGLCQWEQRSRFPLLHIGWAKSLLSCLTKFPPQARCPPVSHPAEEKEEKEPTKKAGDSSIEALAKGCSEALLSRDFLLGTSDQPFVSSATTTATEPKEEEGRGEDDEREEGDLELRSDKMCSLRALLLSDKKRPLNTAAIQLQITAQCSTSSSSHHGHHHHHQQPELPGSPLAAAAAAVSPSGATAAHHSHNIRASKRIKTQ
ncbi:Menin [Halotydeus destructor]|nr:Menin [Halotydeus destructor]